MRRQVSLINAALVSGLSRSLFFAGMAILRTVVLKLNFTGRPYRRSRNRIAQDAFLYRTPGVQAEPAPSIKAGITSEAVSILFGSYDHNLLGRRWLPREG